MICHKCVAYVFLTNIQSVEIEIKVSCFLKHVIAKQMVIRVKNEDDSKVHIQ